MRGKGGGQWPSFGTRVAGGYGLEGATAFAGVAVAIAETSRAMRIYGLPFLVVGVIIRGVTNLQPSEGESADEEK